MKINVGSKNQIKVSAVQDVIRLYPDLFPDAEVVRIDIDSGKFNHPKGIDEVVQNAIRRAESAFIDCEFSFGLEGGLLEVPFSTTGFMEVSVCAIYNGNKIRLGLSPAFEFPKEVTKLIVSGQMDASQAVKQVGLTAHEKLGAAPGGIIAYLSNGMLTREEQIKQSIITALIQLQHPELY